ncbi:MAG: hypothetical protein GY788_26910 [bacterium]|nr:hypothetical protein [bacterium]
MPEGPSIRLPSTSLPEHIRVGDQLTPIIERSLTHLLYYTRTFAAALALFDFGSKERPKIGPLSDVGRTLMEWQFMAARDGAITLNNFTKTLEKIRGDVGKLPNERRCHTDLIMLRNARKQFVRQFPSAEAMRHAVAHFGELATSEESVKRHAYKQGAATWIVQGQLRDRTYYMTWRGKVLFYELSQDSLDNLASVLTKIYEALNVHQMR